MRKKLIKIESLNKFTIVVSYNILQVQEDVGSKLNHSRKFESKYKKIHCYTS